MDEPNFNILIVLAMLFIFAISGCQDEKMEIIEPPTEEVLKSDDTVVTLMLHTVANDGSNDNILDGSSCTNIALPVTVVVSGLEITIDSEEDLEIIEEIFDEFDDDEDELSFLFPITVINADYSELTINNEDELEDLVEDCGENVDDDDIECVDFKYPFSVSVFNTNSQVAEVITFENDKELYEFLDDFDEEDLVEVNFPITLILSDGTEVIANNNDELENIIEDAVDDCDEDDDNDYNDDDIDDSELVDVLIDGQWVISLFIDDEDKTANFTGYIFTFNADGTASATNGTNEVTGTWETDGDSGELEFELEFGDQSPFDELDEDWELIEFDTTIIRLVEEDDDGDDDAFLTFEKR